MSMRRNMIGSAVAILGIWNLYCAWQALAGVPLPLAFAVPGIDFLIGLVALDSETLANEIYGASSALVGFLLVLGGIVLLQKRPKAPKKQV